MAADLTSPALTNQHRHPKRGASKRNTFWAVLHSGGVVTPWLIFLRRNDAVGWMREHHYIEGKHRIAHVRVVEVQP